VQFKINIHAHTIFSDGKNSPYTMALKAKELGFTALVLTDHFYGLDVPEFMGKISMHVLRKACAEAKEILPIIIGIEVPFMAQEVLVFGGAAIKSILQNGLPTMDTMLNLKKETGCAVILCHPGDAFEITEPAIDGFEQFNHGSDYFKNNRSFKTLESKQRWCNSDAHRAVDLSMAHNIVDSKIETESDLIKYIKRGKQPEFYVRPNER